MVQTASLFSQLLHEVPRNEFARLVHTHQASATPKGSPAGRSSPPCCFVSWLMPTRSVRSATVSPAAWGSWCILGSPGGRARPTCPTPTCIAPAAIFEDLFWTMTHRFRAQSQLGARAQTFRFKNKLLSLDSTTISLCLSLFPWATFRRAKGGVKAHVLLDHDDYLPAYVLISQARMHDANVLGLLRLNAGSIVAMDRAYNDYRQVARWTDAGVYFVTRMKDNAVYAVVDERDVPVHRHIQSDAIILLTGTQALTTCPHLLRRIVVWDAEKDQDIVLLTNHLDFGATTIAAIYKERWQIELFFKALRTYGSRVSSAPRRTRYASRFGQPCSPCSCSSGCTTCRKRGGRSPLLPPCYAVTSLLS